MNRILRGVIQIGGNPTQEDCHWNWLKLQEHPLEFPSEEDKKIYKYLEEFYQQMQAPPDYVLVKEYFENLDDIETTARLEEVKGTQCYIRTNYLSIIRAELDRQQIKGVILLCRDASAIAEHGRNLDRPIDGKKVLRGVHDAVNYLYGELHQFTKIEGGEKLEGVVTEDADEILEEYEITEKTSQFANRNLFGFEPIDSVCKGHRIGELWIHAAFASQLKTTIAVNYAYNNVMVYGKNIFYAILEMPYSQLRRNFYAVHSSHGKFVTEWHNEDGYVGLDYRQIRDGELNARDKERFKIVARDFDKSARGKLYIWRPAEEVTIDKIRRKAEMFHNKWGCDGVIIDHLGLVQPSGGSRDYVIAINRVVREARMLALNFARGRAVPLLALFQINRQGLLRAEKNEGRYDFAALAYANECCAEGTLVRTDRGLVPIEHVISGKDLVWSRSGWKKVINKYNNGIHRTLRIKTNRGLIIDITKTHRLRRLSNDGTIDWVYAENLKPGEVIIADFGMAPFPESSPRLPILTRQKWERQVDKDGIKPCVPEIMTEDLAYLMGAFVGDGIYKPKIAIVGFTGNRKEITLKEKLIAKFKSCFSQRLTINTTPSRRSVFDLTKNSKGLVRWFESIGMNRTPGVPAVILSSPKSMVQAFLQGLMDTDGSINNQGIVSVGLKNDHEITLRQVQLLFLSLGIDTTLYWGQQFCKGKKFGRWTLRIRSQESRKKFAELINFTEPHKAKRLDNFTQFDSKYVGGVAGWSVGKLLHKIYIKFESKLRQSRKTCRAVKNWIESQSSVSAGVISDTLRILHDVQDKDLDTLRNLFNNGIIPIIVHSIHEGPMCNVWDLEVSGDHEYETGGLYSHNCERSADVITTTYLDDQLRKEGKFKMGNLKNRDNPHFDMMIGKILWKSKRMRAIEPHLIDLSSSQLLDACDQIMSMEDVYHNVA